MAQRMHIILEDDIDGSKASHTIQFSVDGTAYEIDLNDSNEVKFREAMAQWIGHARKLPAGAAPTAKRSKRSRQTVGTPDTVVRAWAQSNGIEVSERGRVSRQVREAYEAAH